MEHALSRVARNGFRWRTAKESAKASGAIGRRQIRPARAVPLPPRLEKRGLALRDRGGGNVEPESHRGLFAEASYWRWPERELAGNAIDFYVHVLGLLALRSSPSEGGTFHEAMKEITEARIPPVHAKRPLPS